MTATNNSGEPVLAWLSRRSEASRKSEVEFDARASSTGACSASMGDVPARARGRGGWRDRGAADRRRPDPRHEGPAPGMMVMGIIFFMGTISGAHLNPAVTLAFAVRGNFPWIRVPGYIVAQIVGGILAALFLQCDLRRDPERRDGAGRGHLGRDGGLTEAILTLGLVSVILGTARAPGTSASTGRSPSARTSASCRCGARRCRGHR